MDRNVEKITVIFIFLFSIGVLVLASSQLLSNSDDHEKYKTVYKELVTSNLTSDVAAQYEVWMDNVSSYPYWRIIVIFAFLVSLALATLLLLLNATLQVTDISKFIISFSICFLIVFISIYMFNSFKNWHILRPMPPTYFKSLKYGMDCPFA